MKVFLSIAGFLLLGAALVVLLGCARQEDDHGVDKLVQDLGSDQFKTREEATGALKKLGLKAEPALRKALANNPGLELEKRIRQVLQEVAPRYEAQSDLGFWVYQSLAHGQTFRANGQAIDKLYLRVARANETPAADLQVEIRDQWMDGVYARGVIPKAQAGQEYLWREVQLNHRARLTPGQSYALLFHSQGTSNESPWLVNGSSDMYPDGEFPENNAGDSFFHILYPDRLLHVGPSLYGKGTLPAEDHVKRLAKPSPGPVALRSQEISPVTM